MMFSNAGIEELIAGCRVGITTKDKLRKVIKWVQQCRSSICNINSYQAYQVLSLPIIMFPNGHIWLRGFVKMYVKTHVWLMFSKLLKFRNSISFHPTDGRVVIKSKYDASLLFSPPHFTLPFFFFKKNNVYSSASYSFCLAYCTVKCTQLICFILCDL